MKTVKVDHAVSRKERERLIRQQEIMRAARELFARKGYHNTTLEEIAQHAEFGKGTIYNYFGSKEELLYGIMDHLTREMVALARSSVATPGGAREKLTAYARAMIEHSRTNFDVFRLVMRETDCVRSEGFDAKVKQMRARARRVLEIIAGPIEAEIREKKVKPLDALKLAGLFDGMVRSYCLAQFGKFHYLESDEPDDSVAIIVSVFFDGVVERKLKG
jgi:AcrR family transcriptional regulator